MERGGEKKRKRERKKGKGKKNLKPLCCSHPLTQLFLPLLGHLPHALTLLLPSLPFLPMHNNVFVDDNFPLHYPSPKPAILLACNTVVCQCTQQHKWQPFPFSSCCYSSSSSTCSNYYYSYTSFALLHSFRYVPFQNKILQTF